MGDHFGKCKLCNGKGFREDPVLLRKAPCQSCDGSGCSGDAVEYLRDQERLERVTDWSWSYGSSSDWRDR